MGHYGSSQHKKKTAFRRFEDTLVQCKVKHCQHHVYRQNILPVTEVYPCDCTYVRRNDSMASPPPLLSLLTFSYFLCTVAFEISLHRQLFTSLPEEAHRQQCLGAGKHSRVYVSTTRELLPYVEYLLSLIYCSI